MHWKVTGANRQTGKDITITIESATRDEAIREAGGLGLLISDVEPAASPLPPRLPSLNDEELLLAYPLGKRPINGLTAIIAIFAVSLIAMAIARYINEPSKESSQIKSSQTGTLTYLPRNGDRVRLANVPNSVCFLAVDDDALQSLNRSLRIGDNGGVLSLVSQNRVFGAPPNSNVLVIDAGVFTTTVRVLDGVTAGRAGIVPNEFLGK